MRLVLLIGALSCLSVNCEECSGSTEDGVCRKEERNEDGPCFLDEEPTLFRWDPVKVGYRRKVTLSPGKDVYMITRAAKPLLFEIPNFLSHEECDELIELGKSKMMIDSTLHDVENKTGKLVTVYDKTIESLENWDQDNDNKITIDEVIEYAKKKKQLHITSGEVKDMFNKLGFMVIKKGYITNREFNRLPFKQLHVYLAELKTKSPKHKDRYSYQAWVHHSKHAEPIARTIQKRVEKITKLTESQVRDGEPLQIVRYIKGGSFKTHHDSQDKEQYPDLKCCHQDIHAAPKCRLCRFITIMYYLNTLGEADGGGTAFNFADDPMLIEQDMTAFFEGDNYNSQRYCQDANLVLRPVKGTAVMWYNHFVDEHTGWLGKTDVYALHAGCSVLNGEKWIANSWLTAPDAEHAHLKSDFHWDD